MSQERMNRRECPVCMRPLNGDDGAWLQGNINEVASDTYVQDNRPRKLSCGHKATFEAAEIRGSGGWWLVEA